MIGEAIHGIISADVVFAAKLGTFEFTSGVATPAIFTTSQIPERCGQPLIAINEFGGPPVGYRDKRAVVGSARVRIYSNRRFATKVLRDLAWELWAILNRGDLTPYMTGFNAPYCIANGPDPLDDPDGFPGFLIQCTVYAIEN